MLHLNTGLHSDFLRRFFINAVDVSATAFEKN